jgi:WD40 repeat protein
VSRDGERFADVSTNGVLHIWDGFDQPELVSSTLLDATSVTWHPDRTVVLGRGDGSIVAIDPADPTRVLWRLPGHTTAPDNLEISDDGQILVSSTPTESKVWGLVSLQLVVELPGTSRAHLASLDGLRIHTSGATGTDPMIVSAGTWHLDNQTVLDAACQLASRPMTQDEWDLYLPTGEPYEPACAFDD